MPTQKYRRVPMYKQLKDGERVRRKDMAGIALRVDHREGTVVGAPFEQGRGVWYAKVLWDATDEPESVHVNRIYRFIEEEPLP